VRAVRADEPAGRLHHRLQRLVRVADDGHASGDVAERPLGIDSTRELRLGRREPLDQALVGDGRRGMIGKGAQQGELALAEVVDVRGVRAQCAEHLAAGHQRGRRHGPHVRDGDDPVRDRRVRETLVAAVVTRDDELAARHGMAEQPHADGQRHVADELLRLRIPDAGIHGEAHSIPVDEVHHGAIRLEQSRGFLDGMRQHRVDIGVLGARGRSFDLRPCGCAGHGRREDTP
jgi:hypothetical protein